MGAAWDWNCGGCRLGPKAGWTGRDGPAAVFVYGAFGRDRLVSQPSIWRTALYHGAEAHILPSMGHVLPLDDGAEGAAGLVLGWIDRSFT
jgi:hypothetical protein